MGIQNNRAVLFNKGTHKKCMRSNVQLGKDGLPQKKYLYIRRTI